MYVGSKPWRHIPGEVELKIAVLVSWQPAMKFAQEAKDAISFFCNIVDVGFKFKIGSKC